MATSASEVSTLRQAARTPSPVPADHGRKRLDVALGAKALQQLGIRQILEGVQLRLLAEMADKLSERCSGRHRKHLVLGP